MNRLVIPAINNGAIQGGWSQLSYETDVSPLRGRSHYHPLPRVGAVRSPSGIDRLRTPIETHTLRNRMFGWRLSRLIPWYARPTFERMVSRAVSASATRTLDIRAHKRPFQGDVVGIAGLHRTRTGLGRAARLLYLDHVKKGLPALAVDLTRTLKLPETYDPDFAVCEPEELSQHTLTDLVIHLNPPGFLQALAALNPHLRGSPTIVGMWVWEIETLPQSWSRSADFCDALWAPSTFSTAALVRSLPFFRGPIRTVAYASDIDVYSPPTPAFKAQVRQGLGLPPESFSVGYSFSALSSFARKNPADAVEAFQRAFAGRTNVRFLMRAYDLEAFPPGLKQLQETAARDPRIQLFQNRPSHPWLSMSEFYAAIDVYLSLHRSEGYGLTLLEAAQADVPVIATGWGLPPEIANFDVVSLVDYDLHPVIDPQHIYSNLKQARWANPNLESAVELLRLAHKTHPRDRKRSA